MKTCKDCGFEKSLDNFYVRFNKKVQKKYHSTRCKKCEYRREYNSKKLKKIENLEQRNVMIFSF